MELSTQSLSSLLNHLPLSPPSLLPLSSLSTGPAAATPPQWIGARWRSSGWKRKRRRGGRKHRGWRHDRLPAPWSRAPPCRSPETPRPSWTKWTDRTRRGASPHPPYPTPSSVLLLHLDNPPPSVSPPTPPHPTHQPFHTVDAIVGALSIFFTSWYCGCSLSVCYHGSSPLPSCLPIPSQMFHLLTCSQLVWLLSILYSQNNTVYVMQKHRTMTEKMKKLELSDSSYI